MATLIDPETRPERVMALVATGRYRKHRLEASIPLRRHHRDWAKQYHDVAALSAQQSSDLLAFLADLLARGTALERKTFPPDTTQLVPKEQTDAESLSDLTPTGDR
jgi:hypothetical protein